ncbi:MAG: 4Fe-4S dicluster domain-containing protein [Candidatus Methanoperedens sp.]|nr:4Fe-4S dicluster domain-containing protein [Candidatus Methanoperedens sp.]MCE8426061.1 4Fe-4S dicluster domain-containing protein [Candidatus Methanoperedens sp.]MCE8428859.1 4Fe-4S dicluster domain-containing protein [Candidatus Methanoperedens sp.]
MINRRNFLKAGGTVVACSILGARNVLGAEDFEGNPERFGMLTDTTRCIGCRRCEAACNKANALPSPKTSFEDTSVFKKERRPYVADVQSYTAVNRYMDEDGKPVYRKVQCMHCDEPACVSACPVAALTKSNEGPVVWNDKLCIGCRYCITACPFYVPAFEYSSAFQPKIQKCFMCRQRIKDGLLPACAEACPVEAIQFGKRRDLLKMAKQRVWSHPDKYIDHVYGETEVGGTDWLYVSKVPFEKLGFPSNIGTTSLPKLTKDFLSMVNLTLISFPALLGGFYLASNKSPHRETENKQIEEDLKHE